MQVVDPAQMVHPLRHALSDDDVRAIIVRVHANDDTLTLDEIDCAMDWLYDYVAGESQTALGTTVLQ